jgi:tetratricopeptide (TPR) repeat protein
LQCIQEEGKKLFQNKEYRSALSLLQEALALFISDLPEKNREQLATLHYQIGSSFFKLEAYEDACHHIDIALHHAVSVHGAGHIKTISIQKLLEACREKMSSQSLSDPANAAADAAASQRLPGL